MAGAIRVAVVNPERPAAPRGCPDCSHHARMHATTPSAQAFIERWQGVTASELATAQTFVMDLCDLLGVGKPHPEPAQDDLVDSPCGLAACPKGEAPAPANSSRSSA